MRRYPQNTLILTQEPFVGFMPQDIRQWLLIHPDESNLASALSEVWNKTGELGHEAEESDDPWVAYALDEWWDLQEELLDTVFKTMQRSNQVGATAYDLTKEGICLIEPFMVRNGYRDCSGWWYPVN